MVRRPRATVRDVSTCSQVAARRVVAAGDLAAVDEPVGRVWVPARAPVDCCARGWGRGPGPPVHHACDLPTSCARSCGQRNPGPAGGHAAAPRVWLCVEGLSRGAATSWLARGVGTAGQDLERWCGPWSSGPGLDREPGGPGLQEGHARGAQPDLAGHEQLTRAGARGAGRRRDRRPGPHGARRHQVPRAGPGQLAAGPSARRGRTPVEACGRGCGQGVGTRARRCGPPWTGMGTPGTLAGPVACDLPTCCARPCGQGNPGPSRAQATTPRVWLCVQGRSRGAAESRLPGPRQPGAPP